MNVTKKRILFVSWSLSLGGGEARSTTDIMNHLNPEKYDIYVLEFNRGTKRLITSDSVTFLTPIVDLQGENKSSEQKQLIKYFRFPSEIKSLFHQTYDCVIACSKGITSYICAHIPAKKRIVWVRGTTNDLDEKMALTEEEKVQIQKEYKLQNTAFQSFDNIVAIADQMYDSLITLFPEHKEKVVKIYNNIDVETIEKKASLFIDTYVPRRKNVLINVGRLREVKNQKLLIDAMKQLVQKRQDTELVIIGEGILKKKLEDWITEANLQDYITLVGHLENPFPLIKKGTLFCLSSITEGFCLSISEACVLGLPFVSTKVGGALELYDRSKCGILTSYQPDEFAFAIDSLLTDDAFYNTLKANCELAKEKFNIMKLASQVESLIDGV